MLEKKSMFSLVICVKEKAKVVNSLEANLWQLLNKGK